MGLATVGRSSVVYELAFKGTCCGVPQVRLAQIQCADQLPAEKSIVMDLSAGAPGLVGGW